ncbi:hypothetical protein GYB22_12595 [bacterium]|nr:hypothetical protein [bacterium]
MGFTSDDAPELALGAYGTDSVKLTLNKDQSFTYFHNGNDTKAEGTWIQDENRIELTTENEIDKLPTRWKIDEDEPCIKARQAAEFIRLCQCEE